MALSVNFQFAGINVAGAYVRLRDARVIDKVLGIARFDVYASEANKNAEPFNRVHVEFTVDPSPDAPNIHTQAYEAAKLLPEFAGAVDV